MLGAVGLSDDVGRVAAAADAFSEPGERVEAVLVAETTTGERTYVCAFAAADGARTCLALDGDGAPLTSRERVRGAVSIAALCEIAEESAGGGDLEELRSQLVTLRLTENPPGIDEAEDAALALEATIGASPRVASPGYLDEVGAATRRLERALGSDAASPFANAMRSAAPFVDELARDVEAQYKLELK